MTLDLFYCNIISDGQHQYKMSGPDFDQNFNIDEQCPETEFYVCFTGFNFVSEKQIENFTYKIAWGFGVNYYFKWQKVIELT